MLFSCRKSYRINLQYGETRIQSTPIERDPEWREEKNDGAPKKGIQVAKR